MPHLPPEVSALVESIESAMQREDIAKLAMYSAVLRCLHERCFSSLNRTLSGSVTPPSNEGHLLDVQQAAKLTGWTPETRSGLCPQWFYRNAVRLRSTRRPSRGKLLFLESVLISELRELGRLP